ncbi:MAG: hypothetical protein M1358_08875 [Chloroflexi bacterium]|nr:hypothetical protein [Chloroflexota bacterium]
MSDNRSFGDPSRYYAETMYTPDVSGAWSYTSRHEKMLHDLLEEHHDDLPNRVFRTYKQWNLIVREHLRTESALRLAVGDDRQEVPVRVMAGLPAPMAYLVDQVDNHFVWRLALNRPLLQTMKNGLEFSRTSSEAIAALLQTDDVAGLHEKLAVTEKIAFAILQALDAHKLVEKIGSIDQDILGAYFFRRVEIRLYWMVIGIVASILGVSVDSLTLVTLIHELAHAYTHLGRDIDGARWETTAFAETDLDIVEGLAQFYTSAVCEKLRDRQPNASYTFRELLNIQGGPYRAHENWVTNNARASEIIRVCMLECRSNKIVSHPMFLERVEDARRRMGLPAPAAQRSLPV